MSASPNLQLPYLDANQNQKTVTHNAALTILDALVNCQVRSAALSAPPASPLDGQCWIVASGGAGAWTGKDLNIAAWQDGAWCFYPPNKGFVAYVDTIGVALMWTGTAWTSLLGGLAQLTLDAVAVGTAIDPNNPLSAKLNSALFAALPTTAAGTGNVRVSLSKQAAANTASFLFQDNFSARAEIGLAGDDNFHFKVSPDGTTFYDALLVTAAGGAVAAPFGLTTAQLNGGPLAGFRNRIVNGGFAVNQRAVAGTVTLAAGAYGHDRWKAGAAGCTYSFAASGADTILTITAGTLLQVIDGANIEGGPYTASQAGAAPMRVYQGSPSGAYATAPLAVAGLAAATNTSIEFSTGTLSKVQVEPGSIATPFERRPLGAELPLCQRYYYRRVSGGVNEVIGMMSAFSSSQVWGKFFDLPVEMRASPAAALSSAADLQIWPATGAPGSVTSVTGTLQGSKRSVSAFSGLNTSMSSFVAGQALFLTFATSAGWIEAAAEL